MMTHWLKLTGVLALVALIGCSDKNRGPTDLEANLPDQPTVQTDQPPVLNSIFPNPAHPGQLVTIAGAHFGSDPFRVSVTFNGIAAAVRAVSENAIQVVVPLQLQPGEAFVTVTVVSCGAVTTRMTIIAAPSGGGTQPPGGGGQPGDQPGQPGGQPGGEPGGEPGDEPPVDEPPVDEPPGDGGGGGGGDQPSTTCGNRVLSVDLLSRTIRLADGRILTIQTDALIDASGHLTTMSDAATAIAAGADVVACVETTINLLGIVTVVSIRFDLENADQVSGDVASVDPLTGTIVLTSGTRVQMLANADISGDHGSLASIRSALLTGARIAIDAEGFLANGILRATSLRCDQQ